MLVKLHAVVRVHVQANWLGRLHEEPLPSKLEESKMVQQKVAVAEAKARVAQEKAREQAGRRRDGSCGRKPSGNGSKSFREF